jgi:hypothetical protein
MGPTVREVKPGNLVDAVQRKSWYRVVTFPVYFPAAMGLAPQHEGERQVVAAKRAADIREGAKHDATPF